MAFSTAASTRPSLQRVQVEILKLQHDLIRDVLDQANAADQLQADVRPEVGTVILRALMDGWCSTASTCESTNFAVHRRAGASERSPRTRAVSTLMTRRASVETRINYVHSLRSTRQRVRVSLSNML